MARHHDHQHDHDELFSAWPDDGPCCPDEPGVRIRAITFEELDGYLKQLTNPQEPGGRACRSASPACWLPASSPPSPPRSWPARAWPGSPAQPPR